MFVPMKQIVDAAYAGKYGVPAVPSSDEVQIRASIQAAVECRSPLIFLTDNSRDPYFTHYMIRSLEEQADAPSASSQSSVTEVKSGEISNRVIYRVE